MKLKLPSYSPASCLSFVFPPKKVQQLLNSNKKVANKKMLHHLRRNGNIQRSWRIGSQLQPHAFSITWFCHYIPAWLIWAGLHWLLNGLVKTTDLANSYWIKITDLALDQRWGLKSVLGLDSHVDLDLKLDLDVIWTPFGSWRNQNKIITQDYIGLHQSVNI